VAWKLIESARTMNVIPELLTAMCEAAYDLSAGARGGATPAFEALAVLAGRVPDKSFDCALRRAALYRRSYQSGKSEQDGEYMIETLVAAANLGTSAHRFAEAAETLKQAVAAMGEADFPRLTDIDQRMPAFVARARSAEEAAALAVELRANPKDAKGRDRMLALQLIELDDPVRAARYLDVGDEEGFKTNIPLAVEPLEKLSEDTTLQLAEWYVGLAGRAGTGGRELMAARARRYYTRFFELHADRTDPLAVRASLGIQKVGGQPPAPKKKRSPYARPVVKAAPQSGQLMTDLKLAEIAVANPGLGVLALRMMGLGHLDKVTDLSPLGELQGLRDLTLADLRVEDISALSSLSTVTILRLPRAKNVSDITAVGHMTGLTLLNLSGCSKVSDLKPLARVSTLRYLDLAGTAVSDVSPLTKSARQLVSLNASNTRIKNVTPLARLTALRTLDLRGCDVSADDLAWLRKQLPDCKVHADTPGG